MAFMPLIFAFIFYGMPSGLVLYWLCNNILAMGHQYLIGRQKDTQNGVQGEETVKKSRSNSKGKQNLNP
jgi:membrane protein insertase Oxa1/YidC/SpoIIIJ